MSAEKLLDWWQSDTAAFNAGEGDIVMAVAYWSYYPHLAAGLRFNASDATTDDSRQLCRSAEASLVVVYRAAVDHLMQLAEQNGIDSGTLWSAAMVCERMVGQRTPKAGPFGTWPDCFRDAEINTGDRASIEAGEAAFRRLLVKLDETYSPKLVGNKIEDPSSPLSARDIAVYLWGQSDDAGRKRAREWMQTGMLPANLADGIKDRYVVSKSALELQKEIASRVSNG